MTKRDIKSLIIGVAALGIGIWHLADYERKICIFIGVYFIIYGVVTMVSIFRRSES